MSPLQGFNGRLIASFPGAYAARLHALAPPRPPTLGPLPMPDEILLNEAAYAVWQTVKEQGPIELSEVVEQTGINQAQVSAAATEAARQGYFKIDEREREELTVSEGAKDQIEAGLPEFRARQFLVNAGNESHASEFFKWARF